MILSDPRFLLFLALLLLAVPFIPRGAPRLVLFTLVGLGFYIGLSPQHWYMLVLVGFCAYAGGLAQSRLPDGPLRGRLFALSVVVTLMPLLVFKYLGWLAGLSPFGSFLAPTFGSLLLPIGISFYTFLAVGYLVDVYVGKVEAERNGLRFAAFMSFFPLLTAGPIERAPHLLPQLDQLGELDSPRMASGLRAILWGLFLKVVIADTLAPGVDTVYAAPHQHGALDLILATIYFSFQVYADFAGYSLIAIGSARMLGIDVLENFAQPYFSQTLPEYWRRWHITLSSWFRDYVFIPLQLQGRQYGVYGLAGALVFTFVLVGLWHGAGGKYALFGLIHGILVVYSTLTFSRRDKFWRARGVPPTILLATRILVTFSLVSLTFVLFRANDVPTALWIYRAIFTGAAGKLTLPLAMPVLMAALLIAGDILALTKFDWARLSRPARWSIYYAACICIVAAKFDSALKASSHVQQFIYAKF